MDVASQVIIKDVIRSYCLGRLAAGEMGNGVELENIVRKESKKKEAMYQVSSELYDRIGLLSA